MGTATDPYQPCEGRYRLTEGVLGRLLAFDTPISMLTKSTLAVRDLKVFHELDRGPGASEAMSINTLDDGLRQLFEPDMPRHSRDSRCCVALRAPEYQRRLWLLRSCLC